MIADELKEIADTYPAGWFEDAVKEAVKNNVRKLNYVKKILESWKANGRSGKGNSEKSSMFETLS
jgi:DnaD/phage-associated family protein